MSAKQHGITLAANGQIFKARAGFVGNIVMKVFKERKAANAEIKRLKKENETLVNTDKEQYQLNLAEISRLDIIQQAKKIFINSAYGVFGSKYFRLFDSRLASAVSGCGQLVIRTVMTRLNQYMNTRMKTTDIDYVIYADTDSCFLNLDGFVNKFFPGKSVEETTNFICKVEHLFQGVIDNALKEVSDKLNCPVPCMTMKREVICNSGIWTGKKRYAMNIVDKEGERFTEPEFKVTGMDIKKSTTPSGVKPMLNDVLKICLLETEDALIKYIEGCKKVFFKLPVAQMSFVRGVSKVAEYDDEIGEYSGKSIPIHSRAAEVYNNELIKAGLDKEYNVIRNSDKVRFTYMRMPNPTASNVIAFSKKLPTELDLEKYVDVQKMWEKGFMSPVESITDAMGWETKKSYGLKI